MRLSTKGRFAVCAMIDVALMFSKLRRQGLVESTRGPGGGYSLGRAAKAITVADIIDAVESNQPHTSTDKHIQGAPTMPDMTKDLWDALNSKMRDYLQSITLRALAGEQCAKGMQISPRPAAMRGIFVPRKEKTPKGKVPNSVFALAGC